MSGAGIDVFPCSVFNYSLIRPEQFPVGFSLGLKAGDEKGRYCRGFPTQWRFLAAGNQQESL